MKRLDDAIRDNDNILAVLTGAGANQDGARSNSITAPSVTAPVCLLYTSYGII